MPFDSEDLGPGALETDPVEVRTLTPDDLNWVVQIDKAHSGKPRHEYFRVKLKEAQTDTGIRVSLAAVVDRQPAGFLMGRLYYGEFGLPEPVAILDTIGVSKAFSGKHVGKALMRQFMMNLRALGIEKIQTQVEWDQSELIKFFRNSGFTLAPRLCLEAKLDSHLNARE